MTMIRSVLENEPIEASAPCRIDMGGTLDLSTFYLPLHHLGPCTFNAALDLRTHVRLLPYDAGRLKLSSVGFEPFVANSDELPFDHPLGLMLAVASYFQADGIHIDIRSSSPPRSALGGSSSAAVALIWAFYKTLAKSGRELPPPGAIALLGHAIEQSLAGVPCGMQDHLAAVFGGVNAWHWKADPTAAPFERETVVALEACARFSRHLMVAYCGVPHISKDINGTWVRQFTSGRNRDIWHHIIKCSRQFIAAIANGFFDEAQARMNEETELRRKLTPDVLDELGADLVTAARKHHCGARFTGAGGGGCLWALGSPERIEALKPVWADILSRRENAKILEARVDAQGLL